MEYRIRLHNEDRKILLANANPESPLFGALGIYAPDFEGLEEREPFEVNILCEENAVNDLKQLASVHCPRAVSAIDKAINDHSFSTLRSK
jgi:hypothetical protein